MMPASHIFSINTWDATRAFQLVAVARQAAAVVIGIIVVKAGWATDLVGSLEQWFFLGALITLGFVVGTLQAFTAIAPQLSVRSQERFLISTYCFLIVGLAVVVIAASLVPGALSLLVGVEGLDLLGYGGVYLVLHLGAVLATNTLLVRSRPKALLKYAVCYSVGMPLALGLGLMISNDLLGALRGLIIFGVVEHAYLIYLLPRWRKTRLGMSELKTLLGRAIPLGLYSIVGGLGLWFDGWLVNSHFEDTALFANFRYGAREIPGALAIAGAFSTAMIALFSKGSEVGFVRLKRGSTKLMHLFMPLSIILLFTSPWLFTTFYNDDFLLSANIFNVYLLLMVARWVFGHSILVARGAERVLLLLSLAEAAINIGLSLLWVEQWGLVGIAFATVVAFVSEKMAISTYLWFQFEIKPSTYLNVPWFLLYSALLCASFYYLSMSLQQ